MLRDAKDYGLRLQDRPPILWGQAINPVKYKAIDTAEGHLLRRSTAQHIELVAKNKDLAMPSATGIASR